MPTASIRYLLSQRGQKEAIRSGLPAEQQQEVTGSIDSVSSDVDLFDVDPNGNLTVALTRGLLGRPVFLDAPVTFEQALQRLRGLKPVRPPTAAPSFFGTAARFVFRLSEKEKRLYHGVWADGRFLAFVVLILWALGYPLNLAERHGVDPGVVAILRFVHSSGLIGVYTIVVAALVRKAATMLLS